MATVNEDWLDALIRHQIGLLRHSASLRMSAIELMDASEADLRAALTKQMHRLAGEGTLSGRTADRLKQMLKEVKDIRKGAMRATMRDQKSRLVDLAQYEADYNARLLQSLSPVEYVPIMPEPALLKAIIESRPMQGQVIGKWGDRMLVNDVHRIANAVQLGMVQGDSAPGIVRKILGTEAMMGADGVTQLTRTELTSFARTAVMHVSSEARTAFAEENKDIFGKERYVAVLDGRTTPQCRGFDGQVFKVREGPQPPIHWNCRSTRVPIVSDKIVGNRPFNPTTEKQLVREYAEKNGYNARTRDALPKGTKGAFDKWARQQARARIGQVPASTTYNDFLTRQSAAFQNEVLGAKRAALFRKGGLTLDKFTDKSGLRQLNLKELAAREAKAFRRAGLDPNAF